MMKFIYCHTIIQSMLIWFLQLSNLCGLFKADWNNADCRRLLTEPVFPSSPSPLSTDLAWHGLISGIAGWCRETACRNFDIRWKIVTFQLFFQFQQQLEVGWWCQIGAIERVCATTELLDFALFYSIAVIQKISF